MLACPSQTPLWLPGPEQFEHSHLARFARSQGFDPGKYEELHRWSVSDLEGFWNAVWEFAGIIGERGRVALVRQGEGAMFGARWYPEARFNFAENLLCGADDRLAVVQVSEDGVHDLVCMGQLRTRVASLAQGLRLLGVQPGDVVGGILPNRIEALVALLACASIGAVWTTCSPDFGAPGILDRIGQVHPKVLFAVTRYRYNGKVFDVSGNLARVLQGLHGLQHLVVVGEEDAADTFAAATRCEARRGTVNMLSWQQASRTTSAAVEFTRLPFAHPLYILFTSGTTGLPKAIVHTAGGVLLQHRKEHLLHCDARAGDVMIWYTSTAWMMYHWLVSGLASHAAIVLYDGAPIIKREGDPDLGPLWRVAENAGVTHFGTSPKYLATLQDAAYAPGEQHDLRTLRSLLCAGAPVQAGQFHWLYRAIKADMMFASVSGGTEILGCFVLGSPLHPVWPGEITCKALGHAVDVFDDRGASCIGRKGNLVCTEPFPSAPLTFWGEDGDARYHATYFEEHADIWTHGDLAEQTIRGSVIIYGRTDTTLKPGGVRIGTAEIYRLVETQPAVQDALVFGWPTADDEEIVLCLLMKDGCALDDAFKQQVRADIRRNATPRHVPHHIFEVNAIPYTLNGKRVEGAARATALGLPVKNRGSLVNPESLGQYRTLFGDTAAG